MVSIQGAKGGAKRCQDLLVSCLPSIEAVPEATTRMRTVENLDLMRGYRAAAESCMTLLSHHHDWIDLGGVIGMMKIGKLLKVLLYQSDSCMAVCPRPIGNEFSVSLNVLLQRAYRNFAILLHLLVPEPLFNYVPSLPPTSLCLPRRRPWRTRYMKSPQCKP